MRSPKEAYDYEFYADRLADPELLENSLALRTLRIPFLAVPVGGSRQGGSYEVTCSCFGLKVSDALRDRHGYPGIRLRWATSPHDCYVVEWGERSPMLRGRNDVATLGRFYGYTDLAIADAITKSPARRGLQTPSSATDPRSPASP
ncbi:DUF6302 family protein (plasmid) [Streptomyces sp. NBC_01544]|uniref:DUF6302 family protein n=1 Tax=Streptomyces sp. NBC_01544 TaxID=2975871 RepID=UPI00386E8AC6